MEAPKIAADPFTRFKMAIAEQVAALAGIQPDQAVTAVEIPKIEGVADFALCVAKLNRFTKLKGKPADIATEWANQFTPTSLLTSAKADGPYINYNVDKIPLAEEVLKIVHGTNDQWGSSTDGNGRTIVVEYSSPNIAKPFHFGHLRSTMIGNFLRNLYKALGYNVVGINYLGDWGKQYGLLAVGFSKYGSEEELVKNPIRHLYDVYVQINKEADENEEVGKVIHDEARAYFRKMEDGDAAALSLWKRFRDLSIEEYKILYKRLNVDFDVYSGESMFSEGMVEAVQMMQEKGLLQEDNGALVCDLSKFKLGKIVVKKSDGTTLYITRDIAAAIWRHRTYSFEKMFYVVGSQQNLHFQQLFKILELMGFDWAKKCTHINFGMITGMSTRKGTAKFLSDILEAAQEQMLDRMKANEAKMSEITNPEHTADVVGVSAVVVQDFSARRVKDYAFNLDRATAAEGDTGPYLQYAHARLSSMERKNDVKISDAINYQLLNDKEALDLMMKLARLPEVIKRTSEENEPCTLVTYLMDLCHSISAAHRVLWVMGREQDVAEARMLLFWAARKTLENGLKILGLSPLQRM
jgi:arginyl-tRNA synthetase